MSPNEKRRKWRLHEPSGFPSKNPNISFRGFQADSSGNQWRRTKDGNAHFRGTQDIFQELYEKQVSIMKFSH